MDAVKLKQGAEIVAGGVLYRVWAPEKRQVEVCLYEGGKIERTIELTREADGHFGGIDPAGRAGDRYKIKVDGEEPWPPPAGRFFPEGVHGPAEVIDARGFPWTDSGWERPAFRDLVIYELHVGTFTMEGTFRAAIKRLPFLRDLGVNALELMPVADFPGERGWGYDGVQIYAPARCYGTPDDLRALVDAAHAHDLAVILDVVYNHFGPDGNYLGHVSPHYFSHEDHTPWGDSLNFGHAQSGPVRAFFRGNVEYWMEDFHIDGFRLDATHAMVDASPRHLLRELAETVHARGAYIIAEDERNEARLIADDGYGLNAVWADDFHHTVEVATIEASVYREDFSGELAELVEALTHGWYYTGQMVSRKGRPRGSRAEHLPPERFVYCISNHDQIGNRALGERLSHLVSGATYRTASALLLLAPYTPLLFMGQEWGVSTPFQYFTDHHGELGLAIEKGRRREFSAAFAHLTDIPSPQAPETFQRSKLRWEEINQPGHAEVLALYRELLRVRKANPEFRPEKRGTYQVAALKSEVLALRLCNWLILCDLQGGHEGSVAEEEVCRLPAGIRWKRVLAANETRFGGENRSVWKEEHAEFRFPEPELLLLWADTSAPAVEPN